MSSPVHPEAVQKARQVGTQAFGSRRSAAPTREVARTASFGSQPARATTQGEERRIAVVDDDTGWLEVVEIGLTSRGYHVHGFERGGDLLDSEVLHEVDVVVADYHLPDMDGVALCNAVHDTRPTARTILCTGDPEVDVVVEALREGLNDYLRKPVTVDRIDACIQRLLDEHERRRSMRRKPRLRLDAGKMVPGTPYRIDGWIGEGGMGTVYRGTHVSIEREVALKVLHREHCVLEQSVRTFRNEAKASARIGAPNIVDILDFAELEDGRLLIAMELLEGLPLDRLVCAQSFGFDRLIPVVRQICRGLAAAHGAGIVHRDIKPANVMLVRREGRADFVKLVDFGIAGFHELGGAQPVAGTPHYMAPESIQFGTVDGRVDQYAVGCLLYEWATGLPPFDGEPDDVLVAQIEHTPVPPRERATREFPASFEALVLRCLDKDPDRRFADMAELEAALCEVQIELGMRTTYDDLPLPAIDESRREDLAERMPRPPTTRRVRTRWRLAAAVGLVALLGLAGYGLSRDDAVPSVDTSAVAEVDTHVEAARVAASRFFFVYPPADEPNAPTAYSEIVALEQMNTPRSLEAATAMRHDFAETLARQGDRYWGQEYGRGFAREFYAMARVFDPDHPRARDRAALTPTGLTQLQERAGRKDFVEGELVAAESLLALAEHDPQARSEKLARLAEDPTQSATMASRLEGLAREGDRKAKPAARRRVAEPAAASGPKAVDAGAKSDARGGAGHRGAPSQSAARHLRRAVRARKSRHLGDAQMHYHRALDASPGNLEALDGLAEVFYDGGEYGQSVRFARLAAQRGPESGRRWLVLGDALYKVMRYSDALEAYAKADARGVTVAKSRMAKVHGKLGR